MPVTPPEPHIFVMFGATGDLVRSKLLPALHHLLQQGTLPRTVRLLGVGRSPLDDEAFRNQVRAALAASTAGAGNSDLAWCDDCLFYQQVEVYSGEGFHALARRIGEMEAQWDLRGNRVFYLALPPDAFPDAVQGLTEAGLNRSEGWIRLVVEKPFGADLETAQDLNRLVHQHFDESQIYRIDHYLGKETVQNLLVFRFGNAIFESLWNRNHIESVQITVAEAAGAGGRAQYYDHSGALRDMIQNHLSQILCSVAMEVPVAFDGDAIRDEKAKVLQCISPIRSEDVVFGQYTAGVVGGEPVRGYREEPGAADDSRTETYAALRLQINNWRWQGVPFLLRTGKRLSQRLSQVAVRFRCPPVSIFAPSVLHANALVITLQPREGFELHFEVKEPGQPLRIKTQSLSFLYGEAFPKRIPEAYETLLLDVIKGNQTLFVRSDWVEASWRLYTPLLQAGPPVHPYTAGTWGPTAADALCPPASPWRNL